LQARHQLDQTERQEYIFLFIRNTGQVINCKNQQQRIKQVPEVVAQPVGKNGKRPEKGCKCGRIFIQIPLLIGVQNIQILVILQVME